MKNELKAIILGGEPLPNKKRAIIAKLNYFKSEIFNELHEELLNRGLEIELWVMIMQTQWRLEKQKG